MKLVLAPMEGLTDAPMRALLTGIARYDWCVSEFIRINDTVLPPRVFRRCVPEADSGFRTPSGTPVHVQLLGSDPETIAENAAVVAEMGAPGIDLNFGCPAKTVNRHRGGAVLLDEPEVVNSIVSAVRRAVPAGIPVSAKMRLGHRDRERFLDNGRALLDAGAAWITVHARTKVDGYTPPAYWDEIASLRAIAGATTVIANGEVWTVDDWAACRAQSGCDDVMLGRGAVASPGLPNAIRDSVSKQPDDALRSLPDWQQVCTWQQVFLASMDNLSDQVAAGRYKQWLAFLVRTYPQAQSLFDSIRRSRTRQEIAAGITLSAAAG